MGETPPSNPEWAGPPEWRMLGAHQLCDHIMARGEVIVGPYPGGAQVIFAPGTWSNTPAGEEVDYTSEGWRLGVYLEPSPVPDTLETKTMTEVVDLLLEEAPEFIDFVKKRCIRTAQMARLFSHTGASGQTAPALKRSLTHLDHVREEAAEAFGQDWVDENLALVADEEAQNFNSSSDDA
jgi:hypothetical protein